MRALVAVLLAAAMLAACGGGGSMSPATQAAPATTPSAQAGIDFTAFTKELLPIQSDASQPVAVNAAQFVFADDNNPDAFASVLPVT